MAYDIDFKKMKKYLPNTITALRFILTVLFIAELTSQGISQLHPGIYMIFILICLSDLLDGWTARKFKAESALGAKLDIAADCFYIFSSLFIFVLFRILPVWYAVLVLTDFLVFLSTSRFLVRNCRTAAASFIFDTVGRIAAVLFYLIPAAAYFAFSHPEFQPGLNLVLYISFLLATVSMLERLMMCLRHHRDRVVQIDYR